MKCPYCGKENSNDNKFCDGCGAKLDNKIEATVEPKAFDYQGPKKSKTGLIVTIIIISVVLVAGIIIGIILLNGGSKNNNESNNEENTGNIENTENNNNTEKTTTKDLSNNIKYEETKLEEGDFIVIFENNNSIDVDLVAKIEYLDNDGVVVDDDEDYIFAFAKGEETLVHFYATERDYDDYKISVKAEKSIYYKSHAEDVKITSKDNKDEEEIEVTITNNAKEDLDTVRIGVLFYKNNKIIAYEYDTEYDVEDGKSLKMYVDYPYVGYGETFEFDDYKVYIEEAYSDNF